MKIKHLSLRSFRGIKKLELDFSERNTAFVGVNGVGKSTVLDALAIALSQLTWRINGHPKKARPIALDDNCESLGHVVARFAEQLMESAV